MENLKTYHLYLIIYTLEKETRKMIEQENPFRFPDELENFGDIVHTQFCDLEKNLAYFKNRFIILNFNTGLYLGIETLQEVKGNLFEASIITEINPIYFKAKFDTKTQKEYDYLVTQWARLNKFEE